MSFWGLPIQVATLPTNPNDSDVSTRDTIQQMIHIALVSSKTARVNGIVNEVIGKLGTAHPTQLDLVRGLYWWVKNHVKYREDEDILAREMGYTDWNQELLISPVALVNMPIPQGDCDDFAMLIASLFCAAKIPVGFVTIAVDENEPFRFSHVYCVTIVEGQLIYLDASHGNRVGWETNKQIFRKVIWNVN